MAFLGASRKGCVIFPGGILPTDGIELGIVRGGVTKIPEIDFLLTHYPQFNGITELNHSVIIIAFLLVQSDPIKRQTLYFNVTL
jgi:hypothetical protein